MYNFIENFKNNINKSDIIFGISGGLTAVLTIITSLYIGKSNINNIIHNKTESNKKLFP